VTARKYERIVRADIMDVLKKNFEVVDNVFFVPAERELPWARSIYTGEASRDAPRQAPDRWHERDALAFVLPDYHGEMLAYISVDGPVDGKVPSLETLTSMQLFVNLTGLAVANAQAHVAEIERRELLEASQARLHHEATHDSLTGLRIAPHSPSCSPQNSSLPARPPALCTRCSSSISMSSNQSTTA